MAPCAAQASARFAAVVDLPTPPLPEATATMFLTLAKGLSVRCTACAVICDRSVSSKRALPEQRPQVLLQRRLQFGRIIGAGKAQYELDGHHVALQCDGLDRLRLAQGLAQIGIGIGAQVVRGWRLPVGGG